MLMPYEEREEEKRKGAGKAERFLTRHRSGLGTGSLTDTRCNSTVAGP